ncbi:MAG: HEAT repeat domain-containing protein [Candidatus Aminicenantales bacterium]
MRENSQEKIAAFKKQQRLKTLQELVKIKASWVPKVLLEHLEDSSEEIRNFIVEALSKRRDVKLHTLHHKLLEGPWYVKSAVLRILSRKKNSSSLPYIEVVLEDSSSEVRHHAASTLGEIGGKKASELLVRLTKDKNPYVRKKAVEALERASSLRFV